MTVLCWSTLCKEKRKGAKKHLARMCRHSQSQLLEGLDGVEGRVGVSLENLHLVGGVDQITPDQLVQQ